MAKKGSFKKYYLNTVGANSTVPCGMTALNQVDRLQETFSEIVRASMFCALRGVLTSVCCVVCCVCNRAGCLGVPAGGRPEQGGCVSSAQTVPRGVCV